MTKLFLYKLIPPRTTFAQDMTAEEAGIMGRHVEYWTSLAERGLAIVFGPVADPAGSWGLAVIEVPSLDDARALSIEDPAVSSGMATFEVYPMPGAVVRIAG